MNVNEEGCGVGYGRGRVAGGGELDVRVADVVDEAVFLDGVGRFGGGGGGTGGGGGG